MKSRHDRTTPSYGPGFAATNQMSDHKAFLAWWNERSFFPVSGPEVASILGAPEMRRAA